MYVGIDFLISPDHRPYVVEVNVGLPGGAQEYDLTHLVYLGEPSGIFEKVEKTSLRAYGKGFQEYLSSLPFIESLKPFKIWMDGQGSFPKTFHPGLRLEDKWVQYQILRPLVPMPKTMVFDPLDISAAKKVFRGKQKLVLKRRLGRGGRDFQVIGDVATLVNLGGGTASRSPFQREPDSTSASLPPFLGRGMKPRPATEGVYSLGSSDDRLPAASRGAYSPIVNINIGGHPALLQEYIESRVDGFIFSIRSVAFGGEFMCMYANLTSRAYSNHGILAFVSAGDYFGLANRQFKTQFFNQKSWEAELWFGQDEPPYLRHNLYEDEVAQTALILPAPLYQALQTLSVKIEKFYDALDFSKLPRSCL